MQKYSEINFVYFGLLMEMYCMSELCCQHFFSSPQGQDLYFQLQISGGFNNDVIGTK
jgi:hypothetical protein